MKERNENLTVLIVEDHDTMRNIIKGFLRNLGFVEILEANDGTRGWRFLQEAEVDLVISDWNMPVMSGMELLKLVRASPAHEALPFLMVTSEAAEMQVREAIAEGVTNYIVKPFTMDTLSKKIDQMLAE